MSTTKFLIITGVYLTSDKNDQLEGCSKKAEENISNKIAEISSKEQNEGSLKCLKFNLVEISANKKKCLDCSTYQVLDKEIQKFEEEVGRSSKSGG